MANSGTRVLCVCVEAVEQRLLLQWASSGRLPAFRRLREGAAWGTASGPPALYAGPGLWPTIYTSTSPAQHGRYSNHQFKPGTYDVERVRGFDTKHPPFWETLSRAGKRVAVIDAPKTMLSRDLNGVQLADWGTHSSDVGFSSWPDSLRDEVERRYGTQSLDDPHRQKRGREFADFLQRAITSVDKKAALVCDLLTRDSWDLFFVVFPEAHWVGDQCWHLHDPAHPLHDAEVAGAIGDPLESVYAALDRVVGRLLEIVGPEAFVFVFSGNGMGPNYTANPALDGVLHRLGVALPVPPPRPAPGRIDRLRERTPAAIRSVTRPVLRHLRAAFGRNRAAAEPRRGQCFTVPTNDVSAGIRINVAGREPRGCVEPGAAYERLCDLLVARLSEMTNANTGAPAVRRVLRTRAVYRGDHVDALPDLLVEWNRDAPITALDLPGTGAVENPLAIKRTGDHTQDGVFFATGAGIGPRPMPSGLSVVDFAPTFAARLGVALGPIEGRAIDGLRPER